MPVNAGITARQQTTSSASGDRAPIAVIGAGPYGLATAAWLSAAGVPRRVFGDPMEGWHTHMPQGMLLKSVPAASSISAPEPGYSLADFRAAQGLGPVGDTYPIPVEELIAYGRWFQERRVPELERQKVRSVESVDGLFGVTLTSGEQFLAGSVVVATGQVPFTHEPAQLRGSLPDGMVSHTSQHRDLAPFVGRRVAVLGAGQSALESAALLHEAGAQPIVIARAASLRFGAPPDADRPADRPLPVRIVKPGSLLGPGWSLLACSRGGPAYRHLPRRVRTQLLHTVLGPAGAWWLRDRVDGRFPVLCGRTVRSARPEDGSVRLELARSDGRSEVLSADHLLLATGYRVDVHRLELLSPELRREIRTSGGAPRLSAGFESSVPGLYFTGLAAAPTFGPVMRFVAGTAFAARRVAASVAAGSQDGP
ncbi:NAD(P)-binding domain-containing protein [Streptomyces cavernae]|uniref:NAD(P)-binding domain-containing protein n=1 Tax=Streptomyces cavernae TaxID=2259034 RepID=UPI000FEC0684|nr:NAD(P)-binding domain-containing protein [Streptomyces cavernae]